MKLSKLLQIAVLGGAALAIGIGNASAACTEEFGGFAVFQCAELAYFEPAPFPVGYVGDAPENVSAVFWQLSFGNATGSDPLSNSPAGVSGKSNFVGVDSGGKVVDLVNGNTIDTRIPPDALCLRSNNWGDSGVDGCVDNSRGVLLSAFGTPFDNDNILNPYYDVGYAVDYGPQYVGNYSLTSQQDAPMGVLLRSQLVPADPTDNLWFAIAAVGSNDRGNDGTGNNGPCAYYPGTNPGPCDLTQGSYNFKEIGNGLPNPNFTGVNNIVPWQQVPKPHAVCVAGCSGTDIRTLDFTWDTVKWAHDAKNRASTNPYMGAPSHPDGTSAMDYVRSANARYDGLVRYDLEQAPVVVDPNGDVDYANLAFAPAVTAIAQATDAATGEPLNPTVSLPGFSAPPDTCYRLKVYIGTTPDPLASPTTLVNCRTGRCGDKGYEIASKDPAAVVCIGGALVSERAINVRADKAQGSVIVKWDTTAELSMTGFRIVGITKKGGERTLGDVACNECNSGVGSSYTFESPKGSLKGGVDTIRLEVQGGQPSSNEVPLK